jgi:hypothetical protein
MCQNTTYGVGVLEVNKALILICILSLWLLICIMLACCLVMLWRCSPINAGADVCALTPLVLYMHADTDASAE